MMPPPRLRLLNVASEERLNEMGMLLVVVVGKEKEVGFESRNKFARGRQ